MAETMTLTTVLIDISTISALLFVGFLIRQKIPFFYKYYIPTSLIAGILGLLLGPQVLGQLSPIHLHFSQSADSRSGIAVPDLESRTL